jgi:hypothetical protein
MSTQADLRNKVKSQAQVILEQEHTINSLRSENMALKAKLIARQRKKQNHPAQGAPSGR